MSVESLSNEEYIKLLDMMDMLKDKYPEKVENMSDSEILNKLYQSTHCASCEA